MTPKLPLRCHGCPLKWVHRIWPVLVMVSQGCAASHTMITMVTKIVSKTSSALIMHFNKIIGK